MADRCFACGKSPGKGYGARYWIRDQPHALHKAVKDGRIKINFVRRLRLEKIVRDIRSRKLRSFPGIVLCPDCRDIVEFRTPEIAAMRSKQLEAETRELLQKYLKETRPDLSQKARDELVEQSINKQTQK